MVLCSIQPNSFIPTDSQLAQTLLSRDPCSFAVEGLLQPHQFQLWCQEQAGASWNPVELRQLCQEAIASTDAKPSSLQGDIVVALGQLQDVTCVEVEVST
jgi:hypothetical protein